MRIARSPDARPRFSPSAATTSGLPRAADRFERAASRAGFTASSTASATASATAGTPSVTDDVVERVFRELLGRSAGAPGFWHAFAAQRAAEGMPLEDIERTVSGHVTASLEYRELQATNAVDTAFRELLERDGGAGFWHAFARQRVAEGMPLAQIDETVRGHLKASAEYQVLRATDVIVDRAFLDLLGRESGGAGFWHEFAEQKQSEGVALEDIDRQVRAHLSDSAEYRTLHPALPSRTAEQAFLHQPNDFTCGPTSLTMALAHRGLGEATAGRALQIADETGTSAAGQFPGGVALMAQFAIHRGLQARSAPSREVAAMRAELAQGRSLIVNGTHASGVPHFVYVAGLAADGRFIVNDPASGGTERYSDADLHAFTHRGNNPPGYAAVWT